MEPTAKQPQTTNAPAPSGPKFSQVFSITVKVLLALLLVSAIIGAVYGMLSSIGNSSSHARSDYSNEYLNGRSYYNQQAEDAPTKVPLSQWKRMIAQDIKGHCIREGMTTAEVEQSVGKPTNAKTVTYNAAGQATDKGDVWEYSIKKAINKPCSQYEGEKCADPVEYETKTSTLYFSPKGNLTYPYLSGNLKTYTFCD